MILSYIFKKQTLTPQKTLQKLLKCKNFTSILSSVMISVKNLMCLSISSRRPMYLDERYVRNQNDETIYILADVCDCFYFSWHFFCSEFDFFCTSCMGGRRHHRSCHQFCNLQNEKIPNQTKTNT